MADDSPKPDKQDKKQKQSEFISVASSWISGAFFEEETNSLTLFFKSGGSQTVSCDKATFEAFRSSGSKGQFWHQNFK